MKKFKNAKEALKAAKDGRHGYIDFDTEKKADAFRNQLKQIGVRER